MREIIFIGSDYYPKSKTVMSCIYEKTTDGYKRFDWGFFEIALAQGEHIFARQATTDEKEFFKKWLEELPVL